MHGVDLWSAANYLKSIFRIIAIFGHYNFSLKDISILSILDDFFRNYCLDNEIKTILSCNVRTVQFFGHGFNSKDHRCVLMQRLFDFLSGRSSMQLFVNYGALLWLTFVLPLDFKIPSNVLFCESKTILLSFQFSWISIIDEFDNNYNSLYDLHSSKSR